ncbi:MAG: hypothetical protein O7E52_11195, partial [Candidatus Poribacteria bacterium]|nr:hypothetical protein [Candidatus Poribacteria bacterium]
APSYPPLPGHVGSLRDRVKVDSLVQFFTEVLSSENPQEQLESVAQPFFIFPGSMTFRGTV